MFRVAMKMNLKQMISPKVVRWIAVGFVFAGVGLGLLKLLAGVLAWPYTVATFCSGEICTVLRFLVVDRWVFNHRTPTWKRLWQYHVANALGFGVWWSAANLLQAVGVHYLLASVLAMFFSVGFNMLSNFFWIWRKPAVGAVTQESR
jgi:putative flippase GtrA